MTLQVQDFLEFQKCVVADLKMFQEKQRALAKIVLFLLFTNSATLIVLIRLLIYLKPHG